MEQAMSIAAFTHVICFLDLLELLSSTFVRVGVWVIFPSKLPVVSTQLLVRRDRVVLQKSRPS